MAAGARPQVARPATEGSVLPALVNARRTYAWIKNACRSARGGLRWGRCPKTVMDEIDVSDVHSNMGEAEAAANDTTYLARIS